MSRRSVAAVQRRRMEAWKKSQGALGEVYPNTGKSGQAIADLKEAKAHGVTQNWSPFWRTFSEQLLSDIEELEKKVPA